MKTLESLDETLPRILPTTGRLIGEGFDHAPLDTLVLAMSISWKDTLRQYAGRLHREHADKQDVRVYDYVESDDPRLLRMRNKRRAEYRSTGHVIRTEVRRFEGCACHRNRRPRRRRDCNLAGYVSCCPQSGARFVVR